MPVREVPERSPEPEPSAHVPAVQGAAGPTLGRERILALQRTAGNAAVCALLRARRTLARMPGPDDGVIAEAKRMVTQNDRGPDRITALLRKFGKGRVAAPQKHVTMLAAGVRGYAFRYLPGARAYLSIGEDFVERLARGDVEALKGELAKVIGEVDGTTAAAAPAPTQAERSMADAPAAAPAPAEPRKKEGRNPRNGPFRQKVNELLAPVQPDKEVKEGSKEFDAILKPGDVRGSREAKAREHYKKGTNVMDSKYSTCIDFMIKVLGDAKKSAGGSVKRIGSDAETYLKDVKGAWYFGDEIDRYDPEAGDVYVFYFPKDHPNKKLAGGFSHIGFIRSVGPVGADGKQTWVTVDAGQGTAGVLQVTSATPEVKDGAPVLDKDGNPVMKYTYKEVVKGAESIKARVRTFDTKKKLMYGGENEDKDPRVLRGWVDIDQVVTLPAAK